MTIVAPDGRRACRRAGADVRSGLCDRLHMQVRELSIQGLLTHLYVPPGLLHGFQALTDAADVC
ncbi:MAG: hypothetical protein ACT4RN_14125 [Pseudonocardia sp.]